MKNNEMIEMAINNTLKSVLGIILLKIVHIIYFMSCIICLIRTGYGKYIVCIDVWNNINDEYYNYWFPNFMEECRKEIIRKVEEE